MIVTLDAKHRLTVPATLVKTRPGEIFEARYDEDDDSIMLRRVKKKRDWLDVLKQCPSSMDDIPPRSRELSKENQVVSWLVDTDVISQPPKKNGNSRVIIWLETNRGDCYTSTVVIAQLAYWVRAMEGKKRVAHQAWLTLLLDALEGRILSFNSATAHIWAEQKHLMAQKGYSMPVEDSYIAATARRHGLTIVTGNDKDFRHCGVKVFNPFKD